MVTPYLSRLRPAEPGSRLRPRPRSRFEPVPVLPIDGPAAGSLGLSVPSAGDTEAADVEIELDQDPPDPRLSGPAVAAAAAAGEGLRPARTAGQAPQHGDRAPARAGTATGPSLRDPVPTVPGAGDIRLDRDPPDPRLTGPAAATAAPGDMGLRPVRTAPSVQDKQPEEQTPARAGTATGPAPADFRPTPAEAASHAYVPVLPSAAHRSAPQRPAAPLDRALDPDGRASSGRRTGAEPAPPEAAPTARSSAAPNRHVDQASHSAVNPADRVQAMARWLRDADDSAASGQATMPSAGPRPGAPGRVPGWPGAAVDTEVTVTIGRIEVKAATADPVPMRPPSSGPRNRVPSLGDYLESRTRVRGRLG